MSIEGVALSDTSLSEAPEIRRRLLGLMASLALVDPPKNSGVVASTPWLRSTPDPITGMFVEIREKLHDHEQALARCYQIEAKLVADIGYPRVRLPNSTAIAPRFAADAATITRDVPPSPHRDRLHRRFHLRQERWRKAAHASGLVRAQVDEADRFVAVRAVTQCLYGTPAATVTGVMLKPVVLLSHKLLGVVLRVVSPWWELHIIFTDLDRLAAVARRTPC